MGSDYEPLGLVRRDEITSWEATHDPRNRAISVIVEARGMEVRGRVDDLISTLRGREALQEAIYEKQLSLLKQIEIATWPI